MDQDLAAGAFPPSGGHVIVSTKSSAVLGCGGSALVVGVVGLLLALISRSGPFGVFFVLLSIVGAVVLVIGLRESSKWEPFELVLPEWPLSIGSDVEAQLVRRAKRSVPDRDVTVDGVFVCTETVTFQQGTDTRTERTEVCKMPLRTEAELRNGVFQASFRLYVPTDAGAPTFSFEHNSVSWRVELEMPQLSKFAASQSFEVDVAPVLSGRAGVVQDSPRPPT